jgi:hypothetical protein
MKMIIRSEIPEDPVVVGGNIPVDIPVDIQDISFKKSNDFLLIEL